MTAGEDIVRDDTDEISDDTKTEPAITIPSVKAVSVNTFEQRSFSRPWGFMTMLRFLGI